MTGSNEILTKLERSKNGLVADRIALGSEDQDGIYRTLLNLLDKGLVTRKVSGEGNDKWIWSITKKGKMRPKPKRKE